MVNVSLENSLYFADDSSCVELLSNINLCRCALNWRIDTLEMKSVTKESSGSSSNIYGMCIIRLGTGSPLPFSVRRFSKANQQSKIASQMENINSGFACCITFTTEFL